MTREEAEQGRDDMLIDCYEAEAHDLKTANAMLEGFNANYHKVCYDKFPLLDGKHPACDQSYFGRREFSFTLDDDIYLRFQSFTTVAELENSIKEKYPFKIDIGLVYSVEIFKDEFFYFDLCLVVGYVRYCCSGADVCVDYWPLMTVAIKVIDTALRVVDEVFIAGFVMQEQEGKKQRGQSLISSVFMMITGVLKLTIDSRLTNEKRAAIAEYFHVYKGSENNHKKVSLGGPALHLFLLRSYTEVLKGFFEDRLLSGQKILSTEERFEKILDMIPDQSITSELRGRWQDNRCL
ncbi:hypothetical protein Ancab_028961 [Ancistrocladus abbreviatus]